jgi:hypothetical protein
MCIFPIHLWILLFFLNFTLTAFDSFIALNKIKKIRKLFLLSVVLLLTSTAITFYFVYLQSSSSLFMDFFLSYIVEFMLSFDNIIIFTLIFQYLRINDLKLKLKVLSSGLLIALVLRFTIIIFGFYILNIAAALYFLSGIILLYTGLVLIRFVKFSPQLCTSSFLARSCVFQSKSGFFYLQKKIF